MFVLVSYDVVSNDRRNRLAKLLLDYGVRVQKSVFECELDPPQYEALTARVERIIDRRTDRVRYWRLCALCRGRVEAYGPGPSLEEDEGFQVF